MLPTLFRRPRIESTLPAFSRDIDRVFEEFLDWSRGNGMPVASETAFYPVDIRERNGQILVEAEMPGFNKDEIEVTLNKDVLTICAEHKEEKKEEEKGKVYQQERQYRRIERSFTLPASVDEGKVDASLKNGVLHLTLEKTKAAQTKKIAVK